MRYFIALAVTFTVFLLWEKETGHTGPLDLRLASIQAQINRTMDLATVTRLNAEYARLQRELDERDMARIKANTTKLNDFLEER